MTMEEPKSEIPVLEGEENLIAAAQHIVKALSSKKKLTDDMRKILADLGSQLSSMSTDDETKEGNQGEGISDIEKLDIVEEKIMRWETDESMIWDCGQEEISEYLNAVDEARKFTESLESLSTNEGVDNSKLLRRAHQILQTSMARLEEEFRYVLIQNRQPFEPEHMSFRSSEDDALEEISNFSFEDDPVVVDDTLQRDSVKSRCSEEYIVDLINKDVINDLSCIAKSMFSSNYDQECTHAYILVRKDALDECLFILEMEKMSIEDVLRMEWVSLDSKIKRWVRAMKIFVRVYLASEKRLSDLIFGELSPVNNVCFLEASKVAILQLLNFGEAIAIGPHKPEKLFRILDMYEVLANLLSDIDALFSDDAGCSVRTECREVLSRLGETVRVTFLDFENAIESDISANPFAGGAVHPLTKYVMNYIRPLIDNSDTLNFLLKDIDVEDSIPVSAETNPVPEDDKTRESSSSCSMSPIAIHFRSFTSILEANLDDKSKLYRDPSLQHFFLMNNIYYMTQKVKNSELRGIFGDGWIRKHNWKFQHNAMNYERATWTPILCLLKDDGLYTSTSHHVSKSLLKERFRTIYAAFDEVYKNQTAWLIPDKQLRDDLRISTSLKVIPPYRNFTGRHVDDISEKYIKYSADDLENYLMDLFGGSQRSLPHLHRR